MRVGDILKMVRRVSKNPKKLGQDVPFLLKKIKQEPNLEPFDLFAIYNVCAQHPKPSRELLEYIEPSVEKNWITLFRRLSVTLANSVPDNQQILEQFHDFLDAETLNNNQIMSLAKLLPNFDKNSLTPDVIKLKDRINDVLTETLQNLSTHQLSIVIKGLKRNRNVEPTRLSTKLSDEITLRCASSLQSFSWTDLTFLQLLQDKSFFNRTSLYLFKLIKANKTYSALLKKGSNHQGISQFICKTLPRLRMISEKPILQQQSVGSSKEREEYYKRIDSNPLYHKITEKDFEMIQSGFEDFSRMLHLIEFTDFESMIPVLERNHCMMSDEEFIHFCYMILRSNLFINLEKYPGYLPVLERIMSREKEFDTVYLHKLMHILCHFVVVYPQYLHWMKALDAKFHQDLETSGGNPKEAAKYNLSLMKLIGISKEVVDAMPLTANYLFDYFEFNTSRRELMFFHKLEYMMGKTKILPDNNFKYPELFLARSIYEDRICGMLKLVKELRVDRGMYYKGYEVDLLLTHTKTNKKVYLDICGAKHFFLNEHILRPNTISKRNFLKQIIDFQIISPGENAHTNRRQLEDILQKHFGLPLPYPNHNSNPRFSTTSPTKHNSPDSTPSEPTP